jgi:FkbM family methyltransferase
MSLTHSIVQKLLSTPKFLGRDFLIENLPKIFISKPKGKTILQTKFGFKIQIDPTFDKNIENVIYQRGVYELGTVSVLQQFLNKGDVFVDVGANIGFLSLVGCSTVESAGKVYAFEPVPNTFNILKINKELNGFNQLVLNQFALGNETKTVEIFNEKENRGGASILNHINSEGIKIDVKRLDELNIKEKINTIKIDVEGFEFEVLKGAEKTIKKDKPNLIIEYSLERENSSQNNEIYDWLIQLGFYKIYKLKLGKERKSELIEIKTLADLPQHDNIFCIVN